MAKPINRFEVQIVFDGGGYWRETSRRDGKPLTRLEVAQCLEEMAARIRTAEQRRQAARQEQETEP